MVFNEATRTFLDARRFASLATINADGSPQQTVMWYLRRDDVIVMNTARGRKKDRNLLRDPRISVCIEDGYRYVAIAGTVELIEDQKVAHDDIGELAIRYMGEARGEEMMRDVFAAEERISLYLRPSDINAYGFEA